MGMIGGGQVVEWVPRSRPPDLEEAGVHVWHLDLSQPDLDPAVLSEAERERAGKFAFSHLQERYVAAHVQTRMLLGAYLSRDPAAIEYWVSVRGKPHLAGGELHFNLSHTAGHALLAVCRSAEIGVDVECVSRNLDRNGIAERFFSTSEAEALKLLPDHAQAEGFFGLWTRKEAWLKATGIGISDGLSRVEFNCDPAEAPRVVRIDGSEDSAAGWQVLSLRPLADHIAAVAWQGPPFAVETFRFASAR
ncbi:MAG TPA: 4'-phosphopantetheinyl transferase [Verrucomicrobiales bacterium]|nr:4'-phosphopantetheinyl transferase [Verrucomicrobiales bacterium]